MNSRQSTLAMNTARYGDQSNVVFCNRARKLVPGSPAEMNRRIRNGRSNSTTKKYSIIHRFSAESNRAAILSSHAFLDPGAYRNECSMHKKLASRKHKTIKKWL